jgi:hypothetical protein
VIADLAAAVIAIVVSAAVAALVLGAFVWAAIQDGRDERRRRGTG